MLSQAIWWSSIALESLLLFRGVRGKLACRYPAFYFYISFVLLQYLVRMGIARWSQDENTYNHAYWTAEFLCVLVSCGIVFEIYRVGRGAYPGTARMARRLLGIVFVIVLMKA